MHMNANEPVAEEKVKFYLSAETYIAVDPNMSQQEYRDYKEQVIRKYIRDEPEVYLGNKELEDVE